MKLLFKVLDYVSSVLMGSGTVLLVSLAVNREWNMVLGMVAGMMIGMVVLLISLVLFSPISTPFEILPKGMIITMVIGMVSGMALCVAGPEMVFMVSASAVFSMCMQAGFDVYNVKLQGEVPVDEESHQTVVD